MRHGVGEGAGWSGGRSASLVTHGIRSAPCGVSRLLTYSTTLPLTLVFDKLETIYLCLCRIQFTRCRPIPDNLYPAPWLACSKYPMSQYVTSFQLELLT